MNNGSSFFDRNQGNLQRQTVQAIMKINGIIESDERKVAGETATVKRVYDYLKSILS